MIEVPKNIPHTVGQLDLADNKIVELHNDSFQNCWDLEKIDLSNNYIRIIPAAIFINATTLKEITLADNFLYYDDDCFPVNSFQHTSNLKSLSIQSRKIISLELNIFESMLKKLPHTLEELNINVPASDGFVVMFTNFTNLKRLGIYDLLYQEKNNTLTNETFKPLENLTIEELRIKAQNLHAVEPLAFSHFRQLTTLDMSETTGMSVADFFPAWTGLQHTQLKKLVLTSMSMGSSSKELSTQNETFFEKYNVTPFVDSQIKNTRIESVNNSKETFTILPKLESLNMSRNFISVPDLSSLFSDYLMHLSNLRELDISHQNGIPLGDSQSAVFKLPPNLSKLDMSNIEHNIAPLRLELIGPSRLQYFKFQKNYVEELREFYFEKPDPSIWFVADFSRNSLVSFAGSFNESILSGLRVSGLLLYDNKLGDELRDKGDFIFEQFENLTSLDLSSNEIKDLPRTVFKNQNKLLYLNLSRNSLLLIDFQISHMKHIQTIDISDNLVSQFNKNIQDDLDTLRMSSPNLTLNLLRNPLQCSCETLSSLWWMYHRQSMFVSFEDYTCIQNREVTKFKNIGQLLTTLDYQCSVNLIVKVGASLFAVLIAVIAVSLFLYRHKWDVRFFRVRFIADRKARLELDEIDSQYEFDAFVVYDKNDFEWVRKELYEELDLKDDEGGVEKQTRFRLCLHERDFMPGATIEENILRAIDSSRKIIVVLSKNFLQSKWCEFELQMARIECVEKGRNLIIAVMLEPLPVDGTMSRSIQRLIRKNTYIEWPSDPSRRSHFWNQMRAALKFRSNRGTPGASTDDVREHVYESETSL